MTNSATSLDHAEVPRGGSGAMFDRIARRYDLLNRVLSLGADRAWRRRAVAALELRPGAHVLDLATGTADVALEILRQEPEATVLGLDPAAEMLDIGRRKIDDAKLDGRIRLELGDAERLPLDDDAVDGVTIAFGIRNVPDRDRALREMVRVVRPDGRIAILELTEPRGGLLSPFARFHIHHVVPRLGALLSGESEYRYLESSIAAFPAPGDFADRMRRAGAEVLAVRPMMLGSVCLFVGRPSTRAEGTGRP